MASIKNERVTKFTNEVVRPTAERLRKLKAEFASINVLWSSELSALVPNTADTIDDSRSKDGISVLKSSEINDLMYIVGLISDTLNNASAGTIEKPCVRTLEVN